MVNTSVIAIRTDVFLYRIISSGSPTESSKYLVVVYDKIFICVCSGLGDVIP